MATYKVAQDVEAEDKLLGPFSFRQFIYLMIAAMAGVVAWGMAQLFTPLFIIPTPVILFFLVLALPLRKDQPMEIYMAAIVSYYLKPRRRLWQPDGVESLIEITVAQEDEKVRTKDIGGDEADRRIAYLAAIADTQGWSVRNAAEPSGTSMNSDVYNEAQSYQDIFDSSGIVAQSLGSMIDHADAARRQSLINSMHQPTTPTTQTPQVVTPTTSSVATAPEPTPVATMVTPTPQATTPAAEPNLTDSPHFDPYPASMHQHVLNPAVDTPATPAQQPTAAPPPSPVAELPQTTSSTPVSPDIISLANNHDLSIETIAREAHRLEAKHKHDDDEVVISLR